MKSIPGSSEKKASRPDSPEDKINWQDEVRNFDIGNVKNRHCDVVLLVESDTTCTGIVNNFPKVAELRTDWLEPVAEDDHLASRELEIPDTVKFVFPADLAPKPLDIIANEQQEVMHKLASLDASPFFAENQKIPTQLLSLLIKLKIMDVIQNDIEEEKKMLKEKHTDEADLKRIMNEPDVFVEGVDDGKKKKGKKGEKESGKKSKSDKKSSQKGSKGKKGESNKKPKSKQSTKQKEIEVTLSDKDIYIVLAGFYDKDLIEQLVCVGVPLTCIMEVSRKLQPASETQSSSEEAIEPSEISSPNSDLIPMVSADMVTVHLSDIPEKAHKEEIKEFWSKTVDILQTPAQYDFAENMFRMKCLMDDDTDFDVPDTEKYKDEIIMVKHWKNILEHVLKIENIRWRYSTYMRNIKLQTLGEEPKIFNTRCLKYYNKLMGKFSPDCINISLLLTCLIENVCKGIPQEQVCQEDVEESALKSSDRISPVTSVQSSEPTHGGVREQILLLMNRYKKRHVPLDNPDFKYHKYISNPHLDVKVETKVFVVHPRNELQMLSNTYKKLSKEFFGVTTEALKLCKSASERRKYGVCEDIEKIMYEYNLQSWAQALGMTKDQLCDAIQLYLYASIQCNKEPEKEVSKKSTMSLLLPRMNKSFLINDTKVQVLDFLNPDSRLILADNDNNILNNEDAENAVNIYEDMHIENYLYKEPLPPVVVLQELASADKFYECSDVKYCSISDTLLYRFHHKADEFGINTTIITESIRTPTCLRDFCKYVVHEDGPWLDEQNNKFDQEQEQRLEELRKEKEKLVLERYNDFQMPEDSYFYFPDSYKAEQLKQERLETNAAKGKKGKGNKSAKGGKEKSDKSKKSKEKSSDKSKKSKGDKKKSADKEGSKGKKGSSAKSKKQIESNLSTSPLLKTDEPLPKTILSPRCALEGEPYNFIGYDVSKKRFEVESVTTSFHSLDGVSVYVEKLTWLGKPPSISIKIDCKGSLFVIHHNPEKPTKQFLFHLSLVDGTIAAFAKPLKLLSTHVALCKRICQSKKNREKPLPENTAYKRKHQEIYFVSEKHDCIVKSLKVPYSTESNVILSENSLIPFLNSLQKYRIRAKITVPSETLEDNPNLANSVKSNETDRGCFESETKTTNKTFNTYKNLPKTIVKEDSGVSLASEEKYVQHSPPEQKVNSLPDRERINTAKELLDILKNAIKSHLPVFKICSSRLHKFNYVTRTKSYINIPIGNVVKRILYRPKYRKSSRTIQVSKCFPIGCTKQTAVEDVPYEFSLSLPSGLVVKNTPGIVSQYPCIKQYYVDKGPQCKKIEHEDCRIFMRNGNIAVKQCDGNIDVYSSNGSIYHFEVPYVIKTRKERVDYTEANSKKARKVRSISAASLPLHACIRDLPQFQKFLHRILRRRYKHLIDGNESRYYNSRRAYLRSQKKYTKDINQFYLLQSEKQPFPEYTVITPEGKKIKISNTKAYEENKYCIASDRDHINNELFFEREDGTNSLLNGDGVLTTQFPDGTRLTTWFVVDSELIYPDRLLDAAAIKKDKSVQITQDGRMNFDAPREIRGTFVVSDHAEGWVAVHMYYQYSHPNYATVLFGSDTNLMEVTLPNSVILCMKEDGSYTFRDEGQIKTEINSTYVHLKASNCYECDNKWMAALNVEPLYHKIAITPNSEFLRVRDSYGKVFIVDYLGKCTRNLAADVCATNDNECANHASTSLQKLIAVHRDFSGCLYWNFDKVKKFRRIPVKDNNVTEEIHGKHPEKPEVVVFKKNIYKPVHERYIMNYEQPLLLLTKYITKDKNLQKYPAYITQRTIHTLPDMAKIAPIVKYLENTSSTTSKNSYEKFEAFLKQTTEENSLQSRSAEVYIEDECADPCLCDPEKALAPAISLRDRWFKWYEECEKYKQLLKSGQMPCYFDSKFGEEFDPEEYQQWSTQKSDLVETESKSSNEKSITSASSSSTRQQKNSKSKELPKKKSKEKSSNSNSITVEKEKSTRVSETKSSITKTVKETLKITVPNNLLVIYNQEGPVKSIQHPENAVTIQSELPPSTDNGKDLQKILLMTDLSEKCKKEIAKEFIKHSKQKQSDSFLSSQENAFSEEFMDLKSNNSIPAPKVPCNSESKGSQQVQDIDATLEQVASKLTSIDKIESRKVLQDKRSLSEGNQPVKQENVKEKSNTNHNSCPEFSTRNDILTNPIMCQIQRFDPTDRMRATVSQTLAVLFNAGPFLSEKDQDRLIHGILQKANVKKYETDRLSDIFKHEILNCNWVQTATTNFEPSAQVETLKTFLKMLKEHLKTLPQADMKAIIDMKDPDTQNLKYRVTLILGDAINRMLEQTESGGKKLTLENRLSLLDDVVKKITEAKLDPKEVSLFIQSLENAAVEEISKLTEQEKTAVKNKMTLIESVISSLKRYKNTIEEPTQKPKQTNVKVKNRTNEEPLKDQSKLPGVKNIATVFTHYSKLKGKKNTFQTVEIEKDEFIPISQKSSGANQSNVVTFLQESSEKTQPGKILENQFSEISGVTITALGSTKRLPTVESVSKDASSGSIVTVTLRPKCPNITSSLKGLTSTLKLSSVAITNKTEVAIEDDQSLVDTNPAAGEGNNLRRYWGKRMARDCQKWNKKLETGRGFKPVKVKEVKQEPPKEVEVLHQPSSLTGLSITMSDSDEFTMPQSEMECISPSMTPLYTRSITQRGAKASAVEDIEDEYWREEDSDSNLQKRESFRLLHSLGTQTQEGHDLQVQTSYEFLSEKCCLGRKWS